MTWDKIWDNIFESQEWGKYPPEELIRFIARNFYKAKNRNKVRILDVGCGTGAATWYLAREGFSVFGIDGSQTGIKIAKERFKKEALTGNFTVGDLVKLPYPQNFFKLAIDIAAIQHNDLPSQKKIAAEIFRVLDTKGKFFSIMLAADSFGYGLGERKEKNTFFNSSI
jgi:ubiquinone/menaquinone biosynthesis C-methylase UbiE